MQHHPISKLFPLLEGDELQNLAEDIAKNGLLEPIMLFDGMVLDGRNRHAACTMYGLTPKFQDFQGDAMGAIAYVWSKNFQRRDLTPSQRAIAITKRDETIEAYRQVVEDMKTEAAERKKSGKAKANGADLPERIREGSPEPEPDAEPPKNQRYLQETATQRAKAAGTNPKYLREAEKLVKEAPDLAEKVEAGELTIPQAKKELDSRKPSNAQSIDELRRPYDLLVKQLSKMGEAVEKLQGTPAGVYITEESLNEIRKRLGSVADLILRTRPTMHIPCKGEGCKHCEGRGHVQEQRR